MSTTLVYKDEAGVSHTLRFDGVTSEKPSDTSTITAYPVQAGAPVADHVRDENNTINLTVKMTNTPMHGESYVTGEKIGAVNTIRLDVPKFTPAFLPTPGAISGAITGAIRGAVSSLIGDQPVEEQATVLMFAKPFNFVSEMYIKLLELKSKRVLFEIFTTIRDYENMILTGINSDRSTSEDAAIFDLTFSRINIVTTKKTAAPVPAEPRGKKKKQAGVKEANPASDQSAKKKSILKAAAGNITEKLFGGGSQ